MNAVCRALLFIILILLSACNNMRVPPPRGNTYDEIQATLRQGAAIDNRIARRGDRGVPSSVSNALLPQINPNLGLSYAAAADRRFDVTVNNMAAKDFFMGLVKGTSYSMVVSPEVDGTISLDLKNVTLIEALAAVRDTYGFDYRTTRYGFKILPKGLRTQIFTVNYLNVDRTGKTDTRVNGGQPTYSGNMAQQSFGTTVVGNQQARTSELASSSIETRSRSDFWRTVNDSVKAIVGEGDGRSVVVDPQSGVVVVKAYPSELAEVGRYLGNIQRTANRQVILEAKILEVQLNDGYQSGINWNVLGLHQESDFFRDPASPVPAITGPLANSIFRLHARIGDFNAMIKLLETEGNVQTLSSPRISAVNNQKAVIKVGTDEYFVTGVSSLTVGSSSSTDTSQNVQLTPFFSGIALDVTPQIDRNGEVVLHIHPSVSKVVDQTKQIQLGTNNQLSLPLASSSIRESDSIVRAASGQIIVIGGLMSSETSEKSGATPWLSKVPVVGNLARDVNQSRIKSELVILLRPIVVGNNTWGQQLSAASQRMAGLKRGYHFGGKTEIFGSMAEPRLP